ncbi:MAG: HEAT repeat domain-containing protein [Planctomycetota bacterium]
MFGGLPDLLEAQGELSAWSDRMAIVGVHQFTAPTLDAVHDGFRTAAARIPRITTRLPDLLVLDNQSGGWSGLWDPDGLGDMVLVDPHGRVVARGKSCVDALKRKLDALQREFETNVAALRSATTREETEAAIGRVLGSELPRAERTLLELADTLPSEKCAPLYAALLDMGQSAPLVQALATGDRSQRDAAREVMRAKPRPQWTTHLLERARDGKLDVEEVVSLLELAIELADDRTPVEALLLDLTKGGSFSRRKHLIPLLGRLRTPGAKERLLSLLEKGGNPLLRRLAAEALPAWSDDDVRAALKAAAAKDRNDDVRAAAKEALAAIEARGSDAG